MDRQGDAMQFISNISTTLSTLKASKDYGVDFAKQYPVRFGLLAALRTDDVKKVKEEVEGMSGKADGWAVTSYHNGV